MLRLVGVTLTFLVLAAGRVALGSSVPPADGAACPPVTPVVDWLPYADDEATRDPRPVQTILAEWTAVAGTERASMLATYYATTITATLAVTSTATITGATAAATSTIAPAVEPTPTTAPPPTATPSRTAAPTPGTTATWAALRTAVAAFNTEQAIRRAQTLTARPTATPTRTPLATWTVTPSPTWGDPCTTGGRTNCRAYLPRVVRRHK